MLEVCKSKDNTQAGQVEMIMGEVSRVIIECKNRDMPQASDWLIIEWLGPLLLMQGRECGSAAGLLLSYQT